MQNEDFQPGERVWCRNCGKNHTVQKLGVDPCPRPDLPDDMSEREKRMMIRLAARKGLVYDHLIGKFVKKKKKKVD